MITPAILNYLCIRHNLILFIIAVSNLYLVILPPNLYDLYYLLQLFFVYVKF
jgi:hypothetical protein